MSSSPTPVASGTRFAFGDNWRDFLRLVDDGRVSAAAESLIHALDTVDLSGRRFLDIGCGSGLFSLAAHRLGAQVRSFDFDPASVAATAELCRRYAGDDGWPIEQGSILDEEYRRGLGRFDVVYAWGVLHHTGDLWSALAAATELVAPGGLLYVSIYNDQGVRSRIWFRIKRRYNRSGRTVRWLLRVLSAAYLNRNQPARRLARALRRGGTPAERPPVRARGMSTAHDLVDWVGGYPFEVAKPEQVFAFVRRAGFELRYLTTCAGGIGCNEYVFERHPAPGC